MIDTEEKWPTPAFPLSAFLKKGHEDGKKMAKEAISKACSEYGFFQIVNHGVPPGLMSKALELSKTFFEYSLYSHEEKLKSSPRSAAPLPAGYSHSLCIYINKPILILFYLLGKRTYLQATYIIHPLMFTSYNYNINPEIRKNTPSSNIVS